MLITPKGIRQKDGTYIKPSRRHDLVEMNVREIIKSKKIELKYGLFIPGRLDGISLLVDYMYRWFLSKFGGTKGKFFKAINLDGADPFDSLRQWTLKDWVKRQRPKLSVIPNPDIKYNMDNLDDDFNSIIGYINRTRNDNACFFRDPDNNVYLDVKFRLNKVDMSYRMVVGQRGAQYDLYDRVCMSCRVGKTLTTYANVDYLVPSSLIRMLVRDLHFEADDRGMPKNSVKFLEYMNSHSSFPFLYKLRGATREWEFYVRLSDIMVHIREINADIDDGNKQGMIKSDFGVEMTCEATMPSPRFYVYYTTGELTQMIVDDYIKEETMIVDLVNDKIPPKNQTGWPIFLDGIFQLDKPGDILKLSLYDMFKSSNQGTQNEMLAAIDYCRLRKISPEVFMEIKVINEGEVIDVYIDWNTMIMKSRAPLPSITCTVIVYVDISFVHRVSIEENEMYKDRIDMIEPKN